MKITVPSMGPRNDFKHLKKNFLTFLTLKATYLVPHLAIRESGLWMDEAAQNYALALLLHTANENKRAKHAVKCVSAAQHDCVATSWDIMCERLDGPSFARSMSLLDTLMLRHDIEQSFMEYVHFMR
jgi:hypothetical protein